MQTINDLSKNLSTTISDISPQQADELANKLLTPSAAIAFTPEIVAYFQNLTLTNKQLSLEDLNQELQTRFDVQLSSLLDISRDRRIMDAYFMRMHQLDDERNQLLDKISAKAGRVEVLTNVQTQISELMQGKKDKDNVIITPNTHISFSTAAFDENSSSSSRSLIAFRQDIGEEQFNTLFTLEAGEYKARISDVIDQLTSYELTNRQDNGQYTLTLNDASRLSESISNDIKIQNDEINRETTQYQDFSNKYDGTVDALSGFLRTFYNTLAKIINSYN